MSSRASHEPDAARLSLLYTVVFVEIGIAMPFMPVWLNALDLDARVIGLLVALPILMRIVATAPLLALIDRGYPVRGLLVVGSGISALTYAVMPLGARGGWPVLAALIALNAVAAAPLVPSIDYLALAAVRASPRINYARIRLGGSIGFLAANLAGGALLGLLGERAAVPILLTGLALLACVVAASGRRRDATDSVPTGVSRGRLPVRLRLAIAAAALIQASHAAIYAFGGIYWIDNGIGTAWVGALWAIGVAAEIALFAGIALVPASLRTPERLLAIGGTAAILRALGMAVAGDVRPVLPLLQALHGLTFGATHLGAMAAVSALAPEGARGRAQGIVSASSALASATSTLACGVVYAQAGGPATFALMLPLALGGSVFAVLVGRAGRGR